jgi:hypothetical protein
MPLLPEAASLAAAAGCAGESIALRRAALEAANAAVLAAARRAPAAVFEDADVAALLSGGLVDALLAASEAGLEGKLSEAAAAVDAAAPLREAAAGTFYNLCAHARRLWTATPGADATYEHLCRYA